MSERIDSPAQAAERDSEHNPYRAPGAPVADREQVAPPLGDAPLRFWNAARLAEELAAGRVSERRQMQYLLAGWLLATAAAYSSLSPATWHWDWMFLYEFILVVIILVAGVRRCYDNFGAGEAAGFVATFTCLLFPALVRTYVVVWGGYHLVNFLYIGLLTRLDASESVGRALNFGGKLPLLLSFLGVVLTQAVVLWYIARLCARVRSLRIQGREHDA